MEKIKNPTLSILQTKTIKDTTYIICKCLENTATYFVMVNKDNIISSKMDNRSLNALKELGIDISETNDK